MPTFAVEYRTPAGRFKTIRVEAASEDAAIDAAVSETGCDFGDIQTTERRDSAADTATTGDDFTAHVALIRAERPSLTAGEARFAAWQEGPDGLARRKAHQLSADEYTHLQQLPGIAIAKSGAATLEATETDWLMSGPSGTHRLHRAGTDLDRLNAHWVGFQMDSRNR